MELGTACKDNPESDGLRMNELGMLAAGHLQVAGPGTKVNAATGNWFKLRGTFMTPFWCFPSHCLGWKSRVTDQIENLLGLEHSHPQSLLGMAVTPRASGDRLASCFFFPAQVSFLLFQLFLAANKSFPCLFFLLSAHSILGGRARQASHWRTDNLSAIVTGAASSRAQHLSLRKH